jgi:hypothetical protein
MDAEPKAKIPSAHYHQPSPLLARRRIGNVGTRSHFQRGREFMTINGSGPASVETEDRARESDQLGGLIDSEHSVTNGYAQAEPADEFPHGLVYFAELPIYGCIKIGCSVNPIGRLKAIAVVVPERPVLLGFIGGGASEEMRWHQRWAHLRVHREWFAATPELRAAIATAVDRGRP